jgi:hypothetical protein
MDTPAPPRPPVFASAQIRVRSLPVVGGGAVAEMSVCGVVVTLDESEARALCTALRDALDLTPALKGTR